MIFSRRVDSEGSLRQARECSLSVRDASVTFRQKGRVHVAVSRISLDIAAGEFVCLVGPSGCGKSTLLNLLAGFQQPSQGEVQANDRRITGPGFERCVLFQSPSLYSWLTVEDNVLFGPKARGTNTREVTATAKALIDRVGLGAFAHHYPHQLSGGMRHRTAFARALINEPPVLLMDEPFGALDAITRMAMQELLLEIWEERRMTVVFVTHDVEEAVMLADRVYVMSTHPGQIHAVLPVSLPRPRTYVVTETEEFIAVRRQLRRLVEEAMR